MTSILVADIGGTNARFGIAEVSSIGVVKCASTLCFDCASFTTFEGMVAEYLATLSKQPLYACFALAAPIVSDVVRLTNNALTVDSAQIRSLFAFERVLLINDLVALAASVARLSDEQKLVIQEGNHVNGPTSVLAAGTGFGATLVSPFNGGWAYIATEAGHQSFAPSEELDFAIAAKLRGTMQHLSVEGLLSGIGLQRIHSALTEINGKVSDVLSANEISYRAESLADATCIEALSTFFSIFGSVAGDLALAHGAFGGIYLGGGVVTKNAPFIQSSRFLERFSAKGKMTDVLRSVPIHVIQSNHAALVGAAHWFLQNS